MKNTLRAALLVIAILCGYDSVLAQQDTLSAQTILQRAIDSEGGDQLLDSVNTMDFVQLIVTPVHDTLFRAVKKMGQDRYFVCVAGLTQESSTTIYNAGRAVVIRKGIAEPITDPSSLEDLHESAFSSTDFAYKKLGYKLTRMPDEQIENFDCYILVAESPGGQRSINYYDKHNGHLLMVVYVIAGIQHKTIFARYYKQRGIAIPQLLLIGQGDDAAVTQVTLGRIDDDAVIDSGWFRLPVAGTCIAPDFFKRGSFNCIRENGNFEVVVTRDNLTELGKNGQAIYHIQWTGDSDYILTRDGEQRKCRIINWSGNKCYCHCIGSGIGSGQPEATFVLDKQR